ncbi:MAG: FMN-binding protein [Alistipes sp.]|nr:FMN-binding protein [Alistipes sp.]
MNKNSNTYIIVYSVVMVVVVALLLSVTALSLQSRQNANKLNEKKNAILASLSASDKNYDEYITAYAVNADGEKVEADVFAQMEDLKGSFEEGIFPVFEAQDGRVVVPVTGSGLWGPIWGYVALDSDMNTIVGAIFDHSGETPGLGAEIATAKHQAQYVGKQIFEGDEFVSVKLRKGGASQANFAHEVDAISGGTKTSDGVSNMLADSFRNYLPCVAGRRAAAAQDAAAEVEVSNEVNNESNE